VILILSIIKVFRITVSELWPSIEILIRKHAFWKLNISNLGREETPTLLGPLERASLNPFSVMFSY
jgi:hypothetical protein